MITARAFAGKHYAVLGLARSGMASVEALLASGARVTAWDRREEPRLALAGRCELADIMKADLSRFDALVLSPGVPLNTHPIAERARAAGVPMIGDIELFALARPELPAHKVVGITGTNGKSTTTALVHHILQTARVPTTMGGNIGLPILAQDPLQAGGVYVLELSSFQIDLTRSLDCEVAVLLNITPDHLDRYESFEAYRASKLRLFEMQTFDHVGIIAGADPVLRELAFGIGAGPGRWARQTGSQKWASDQQGWPSLQGPHNAQNAWAADNVVLELGNHYDVRQEGLRTFPGLPHRMERLGEHAGVLFVNDSKATNSASTAPALAAFPPLADKRPRLHWICGGLPKSDDLDECAVHFGNLVAAYTIGEAGALFADLLAPHAHVERCEMLCEAARRAMNVARPGDVVLLSPACASYDQFRDYEARGDDFRRIVAMLASNPAADPCIGAAGEARSAA